MGVLSEKHATVACDLFLDQKLYCVPDDIIRKFGIAFPNVSLVPVNTPDSIFTDCEATVYWGNRVTEEIIQAMPELRWIHFGSVGVNRARVSLVKDRRILVTNSKGLVVAPMVVSATAFITSLARGLHRAENLRRKHVMNRDGFDEYFDEIQDCEGQRCLIVGYGDVGRGLSPVLKALGMEVDGIKNDPQTEDGSDVAIWGPERLHALAERADYVVNLLPFTDGTDAVLNRSFFRSMKSSAFFVNIGRGETVDEVAMIDALKNGWIAGAGLDVFVNEPLTPESELWDMENVMLTPHVAGLSSAYWSRQSKLFFHNLHSWLEGDMEKISNIVDMETAY
jgi:phosphoglycerate dehydrogenase-like enzyme